MTTQALAAGVGRPELFQTVYSGMELEPFLTSQREPGLRRELGIPENAKVLGTVARLFPLKGYEELMKIAPSMMDHEKDLYFLFVGNGTMYEDLKRQAEAGSFADRVVFAGLIPPSEVHRYIAQMDLLVHFSLREGLPRAAVQALAGEKPVIAYPLDGTPEVVFPGETGYLCEPGDLAGMEQSIRDLLADEEKRKIFGAKGREFVRGKFDWRKMSGILIAAYEELLKNKKK